MNRLLVLTLILLHQSRLLHGGEIPVVLFPRQQVTLKALVSSDVTETPKELGTTFAKGDTLLRLDDTLYAARKAQAEAALKMAEAEEETTERLHRDQSRSLVELLAARHNVARARSELVQATKAYDNCTLKAPYPGRVVKVHVQKHTPVQPGSELITLVDDRVLRAQFLLPAKLAKDLEIGRPVTVTLDNPQRTVQGTISHIGAVVDSASNTIEVYAHIPNEKQPIRAGSIGTLVIDKVQGRQP